MYDYNLPPDVAARRQAIGDSRNALYAQRALLRGPGGYNPELNRSYMQQRARLEGIASATHDPAGSAAANRALQQLNDQRTRMLRAGNAGRSYGYGNNLGGMRLAGYTGNPSDPFGAHAQMQGLPHGYTGGVQGSGVPLGLNSGVVGNFGYMPSYFSRNDLIRAQANGMRDALQVGDIYNAANNPYPSIPHRPMMAQPMLGAYGGY